MGSSMMFTREEITETAKVLQPYVRRTPTIEVDPADFGLSGPARLTLKLEYLQHAGSFKARGAFTSLLSAETPAAGVAAASGGNHGAAIAYAAGRLGRKATIFVPTIAASAKLAQIRAYGAELVVVGERYADALEACDAFVKESGALAIHAYDQRGTLLGQATVGAEFDEQAPDLDAVLVAVGGGGLIGGVASWFAGARRVVGVEPEGAPTLAMALAAGRPVDAPAGGVAADSLAPRQVGQLMFPIAQRFVEQVVLVEDAAIRAAQETLWRVLRIVAEPGGAAALAALLSGRYAPAHGKHLGVLICGANTDAVDFVNRPREDTA
jgi:threonine dehydratase